MRTSMRPAHILASLIVAVLSCTCLAAADVSDTPAPANGNFGSSDMSERAGNGQSLSDASHRHSKQKVTVAVSGGDYPDPVSAASNALNGDTWCAVPPPRKSCTIHLAAGIYSLNRTIELPPGVALVGEEKDESIILSSASPVIHVQGSAISDLTAFGQSTVISTESADSGLRLERISLQREAFGIVRGGSTLVMDDVGGTTKIVDSDITSIAREPQGQILEVAAIRSIFREGARLEILRSRLIARSSSTADRVVGLFLNDRGGMRSLVLKDTSITAPISIDIGSPNLIPMHRRIRITGGVMTGAINGVAGGTGLQLLGAQVGSIRWTFSGDSILDGVSIVSPSEDIAAAAFSSFPQGQAARLFVLRSKLIGGFVGLNVPTAVEVHIESSILTGRDAPTCVAYDADGVAVNC